MAELGRATFGEDKQRSFKSVVDCFAQIGEERFVRCFICQNVGYLSAFYRSIVKRIPK